MPVAEGQVSGGRGLREHVSSNGWTVLRLLAAFYPGRKDCKGTETTSCVFSVSPPMLVCKVLRPRLERLRLVVFLLVRVHQRSRKISRPDFPGDSQLPRAGFFSSSLE